MGIHTIEITCAEALGQDALFRMVILNDGGKKDGCGGREGGSAAGAIKRLTDVNSYTATGYSVLSPCLPRVLAVSTWGTVGGDGVSNNDNMLQNAVLVPIERSGNNGIVGCV